MAAGTLGNFTHVFGPNSRYISNTRYVKDHWRATFSPDYNIPIGNLTLRVRYTDSDGARTQWLTANFTIEILNNIPLASIDNITPPYLALINQTVYFNGSGFDLEGPIVGYRWYSDLDGLISANASFNTTNLSAGNHTFYFCVMDQDGDWSPEVNFSLRVDIPPSAFINNIRPSPTTTSDEVTLSGFGLDSDGTITGYSWRSDIDGLLCEGPSVGTQTLSNLSAGDHTLYFMVMDNDGIWSGEDNASLHVNARPVAVINQTITQIMVQIDEDFELSSDAFDPDGEIVRYRWMLEGVGYVANGSLKYKHTMSLEEPGIYNFYFDVRDDEGAWSYPVNWTIRVNRPPMAFIDEILPGMVTKQANESFSIRAHATDSDGDVVYFRWDFSRITTGKTHLFEASTGVLSIIPTENLPVSNLTVSLIVLDNDGAWSTPAFSWLYVNKPPTAKILGVDTQEKPGHMEVTLKGKGNDNDGQIVAFQWYSDHDGYFAPTTKTTFELKNLSVGVHNFSLRVQDDFGAWSDWVEYGTPVTVTVGLDPAYVYVGDLAIPKWPLYILLVLLVVGVGYIGSRHVNINIVKKEVVEPRNRLLELRQQAEAAELPFPMERLEKVLDRLDFWHYREVKFETLRIQLQMEKLLDSFAATRSLLTEVSELTDKAKEANLDVDRKRLEKAEKLFEERKMEDAKWVALSLQTELKEALGLEDEEDEAEEPEPDPTTTFQLEDIGALRCGRCGAQNPPSGKLIPTMFKCKECGTEGEVSV